MAKTSAKGHVTRSSGNVFADLGLPRAEERRTQVRLAVAINQIIKERRLSQTQAASLLGVNQPKISALANYQLDGFSVERLMRFLNALGRDVEIVVRRKSKSHRPGKILVTAA
jgi:predicted XRE-type DNA-binding protein